MFREAEKREYRQITAPAELRERVLNMAKEAPQQPKKKPARRWMGTAVAACFALVMMVSTLLPSRGIEFCMDGAVISESAVSFGENTSGIALARAANVLSVPLTVKTGAETTLTPSRGVLRNSHDADTVCIVGVIDGTTDLIWEIEAVDPAESYTLCAESGEESSVLTLAFDADANCWTVCAAQE